MKKYITALFALAIPLSVFALNDIDEYPHKSAIDLLQARGIIEGYSDGTFRPNKAINRAEFLKLLMLSAFGNQSIAASSGDCFEDFTGATQWFWQHACFAKQLGIIHGHPDGTFRGEDTIILAEALKMSFEAWGVALPADNPERPWYERYMTKASSRGIFKRFPFTPDYQLTRGEMALLLVLIGEPIATVDPTKEPEQTNQVSIQIPGAPAICGNGILEGAEQCDDGNNQNSDGCSDICILVSEPIRHGALRIEQQTVANNTQASGSDDVPLFAFTAIAGRQDVYITTLKFKSEVGSLSSAENYRLIVDTNGDGEVDTLFGRSTANGEGITFSGLNILVKDGFYKRIEVWGDIDPNVGTSSIALGFDTAQPDFVEGVNRIDGEDVTGIKLNSDDCTLSSICWITVITDTSQSFDISSQGNLFITKHSQSPSSKQLVAGSSTPSLLHLSLRADSEDIRITELAIEGVPSSVDYLEFLVDGNSQPFATGKSLHCDSIVSGRMCTSTDFVVSKGNTLSMLVRAKLKTDNGGAVSGQSVSLSLTAATTGNVAVQAEGVSSSQQLLQNDGNSSGDGEIFIGTDAFASNASITSSAHTVLFTSITAIQNTNADPDGTLIPTGSIEFAEFTFSAADHSNTVNGPATADITDLVFTVSAVNVEFDTSSFYVFNTQNSGVIHSCSASAATGNITVTCSGLDTGDVSTSISKGGSIELALRGTIEDPQVENGVSLLQTTLQSLGNPSALGTVQWTDGETNVGWVDIGTTNVKSTAYRLD